MRKGYYVVAFLGMLGAASMLAAGCIDYIAENYTPLTDPKLATWDAGPDAEGGLPPECSGEPSADNVIDACGVFAQAGAAASGNGSKAKPYATLAEAIAEAQASGKHVYACASAGGAFGEAVTISAGIEVYGGFDCASWTWSKSGRTGLDGPADKITLTIAKGAGGAKVVGFAISAASPSDMTKGGSSIAVAVDDVEATLEQCDVKASDAAKGADGEAPTGTATKGADAPVPDPGTMNACVLPASVNGGTSGATTCDDGSITAGGIGGKGGITGTSNGDGEKGGDGLPADATSGLGGSGESVTKCAVGAPGKDGDPGGAGLAGSASGDALALTGIINKDDTDGRTGKPGQGGGGGGGAKAGTFCPPVASPVDGPGASGGGGGAGGCGGKGGGGGKAGGSSIAIVSLGTKLELTEITIAVGAPGEGGKGAIGQNGGDSGLGAIGGAKSTIPPSANGCKGGDGGGGGAGGPGGGGRGGHAIGIAYAKTPIAAPVIKTFNGGTAGGTGGDPGAASGNAGEPGKAGQCWDFVKGAACGM